MNIRPRRNRKSIAIRALVEETKIGSEHLIYPIFLKDGKNIKEEISSLPNNFRWSIDQLIPEVEKCMELGIMTYDLFPAVEEHLKDKTATYSYAEENFYLHAIRTLKETFPEIVLMSDVDFVMDSMGKPEVFAEEAHDNNSESKSFYNESNESGEPVKKRLYRDGDSKVIGGVCTGIGHYFGIDPVWLRIALLLMFFFAGTGFLLYLILWIAIPEAKTTSEKLEMKGEKADINNISKAVKEEAEQLKKRMEKYGSDFKNMANNNNMPRNTAEKMVDFLTDVLMNIGKVLFFS